MGSMGPNVDFDAPADTVLSPSVLAHVVLRTQKVKEMVDFYTTFLGGHVVYGNDFLCFITYDDEHHRVALIGVPDTTPKVPNSAGLHHIAFTFPGLADLLLAYRQRKAKGILPVWCVNHGPTNSIYYKDPEGNMLETQVDNFDNPEAATAFMASAEFAANPIGTDFDPEDYITRLKGGEPEDDLKRRVEIGQRGPPNI
ncbi:hypothetical protein G647_02779 [Cladophialophora carrionii CBS 160.54]|uniref:VOC domain-containing protein n=1 Tax=Cladophialophora carrionii CBS 160.54 TaxID=1279043 RepID=V9DJ84_9EURO|nr:uncharacterized protein G647_02779 [Cladophialophora carrionii CBS 160.54]ETI26002.1 hypothetical protein G647_02779 [Cladophialophora carrionii CBS 160.54]